MCTGVAGSSLVGTTAGRGRSDPEPTVTFTDQESDGSSVVIERAATDVDAFVVIQKADDSWAVWGPEYRLDLQAGQIVEDRTLQFTNTISESQELTAILWESNSYPLDEDTAYVAVGEELPEWSAGFDPMLVNADPDSGFNYPYYLYGPAPLEDDPRPLLVEPNNTETGTDDFDEHRDRAEETVRSGTGRAVADRLPAPLVVPVFPRPEDDPVDWTHHVHRLDRDTMQIGWGDLERVDLQLLNMVEDARERLSDREYPVADGLMLNGFSASGNFVDRFAALHPEPVQSITAGGLDGMPILPLEEAKGRTLDYHVGVADVEELTGEPFDLEAFCEVDRFLYMGEHDDSDTILRNDAWTDDDLRETALAVYGDDMQDDRFPYSRAVYDSVDADAVFRMYEGKVHASRPAIDDIIAFHERSFAGDDIAAIRADLGGNVPSTHAHIDYTPVEPIVGEQVAFDATRSSVSDGEIVDFEWNVGNETASGELTTHTFDTAGGHSVALTVTDDAGETYRETTQITVEAAASDGDTETDSAADDDDGDATTESSQNDSTDDDTVPGFGVPGALAALGGLGYAAKRRTETDATDSRRVHESSRPGN